MTTVYVTSAETFSGKSALCVGLGARFGRDGLKAGYMKPVNVYCQLYEGIARDEDVAFAKEVFHMSEPTHLLCPVGLTPARLEQQLRGPEIDFESQLLEAFATVSADKDVMVLEGGRSLREGYVVNLPPLRVIELLDARALMIIRYDEVLMPDRALTGKNYLGDTLMGIVINEVPRERLDYVNDVTVPFLARRGVKTFGVLRKDQLLASPTVSELAQGLHAEILCCPERGQDLVEHLLVGAMSVDRALTYFRRKPNKAVITGGDRSDLLLAALETSTRCLILTGNLYPAPTVLSRAEELHVPVLLTDMDTLSAVDITEGYFGRSRFQQAEKVELFTALLDEYMDFAALYEALGITPK